MTFFQISIIVIVCFIIGKAVSRLLKKDISPALFGIWAGVWLVVGVFAAFPIFIDRFAKLVGVSRGVDLLVYLAIIIIFYTLFKFNLRLNKLEKNISEMVRKMAISSARKGSENN